MNLNSSLRISASGLAAERFRMDVISANIANANTMRVGQKDPYRRRDVVLSGDAEGVRIMEVVEDPSPFREVVDRDNPHADPETGIVTYSNVEPVMEMVNMMSASRAYEANIAAFNASRSMIRSALEIGNV